MHTVGNQLKIHCGCHANQDLFQSMSAGYSLMTTKHTTGPKENYEKHNDRRGYGFGGGISLFALLLTSSHLTCFFLQSLFTLNRQTKKYPLCHSYCPAFSCS